MISGLFLSSSSHFSFSPVLSFSKKVLCYSLVWSLILPPFSPAFGMMRGGRPDENERGWEGPLFPPISPPKSDQAAASSSVVAAISPTRESERAQDEDGEPRQLSQPMKKMVDFLGQLNEGATPCELRENPAFRAALTYLQENAPDDPLENYILGCVYETELIEGSAEERLVRAVLHYQKALPLEEAQRKLQEITRQSFQGLTASAREAFLSQQKQASLEAIHKDLESQNQVFQQKIRFLASQSELEPKDREEIRVLSETCQELERQIKDLEDINPATAHLPFLTTSANIESGQAFADIAQEIIEERPSSPQTSSTPLASPVAAVVSRQEEQVGDDEEEIPNEQRLRRLLDSQDMLLKAPHFLPLLSALQKRVREGLEGLSLSSVQSKPITFLIGGTGSGKTTLGEWLLEKPLVAQRNEKGTLDLTSGTGKIGHGNQSKTTIPDIQGNEPLGVVLADCPGFEDTRGTLHDVEQAIFMAHVLRAYPEARFLLVIQDVMFEGERAKHIVTLFDRLKTMVPGLMPENLSLVVTQVQLLEPTVLEEVRQTLACLGIDDADPRAGRIMERRQKQLQSEAEQRLQTIRGILKDLARLSSNHNIVALLDSLASGGSRISLFSRPLKEGPFENNGERDKLRLLLHATTPLTGVKSSRFALSGKAGEDFEKVDRVLEEYFKNRLKEISHALEAERQKMRKAAKTKVEGWLTAAMARFSPLTFLSSVSEISGRLLRGEKPSKAEEMSEQWEEDSKRVNTVQRTLKSLAYMTLGTRVVAQEGGGVGAAVRVSALNIATALAEMGGALGGGVALGGTVGVKALAGIALAGIVGAPALNIAIALEMGGALGRTLGGAFVGALGRTLGGAFVGGLGGVLGGVPLVQGLIYSVRRPTFKTEMTKVFKAHEAGRLNRKFQSLTRLLKQQWGGLIREGGLAQRLLPNLNPGEIRETLYLFTFLRDQRGGDRSWRANLWTEAFSDLVAHFEEDSIRTPDEVYENRDAAVPLKDAGSQMNGETQDSVSGAPASKPPSSLGWDSDCEPTLRRVGLSLDGGGTRGLVLAYGLQELESLTGQHPIKLFDVMGGSSIGGIISLGLTMPIASSGTDPRYSTDDMVQLFERNMKKMFGTIAHGSLDKVLYGMFGVSLKGPRYSSLPRQGLLRETFGDLTLSDSVRPVVVTAVDFDHQRKIVLFKSTDAADPLKNFKMRDVGEGTSAAPGYFPAAAFASVGGGPIRHFMDGGTLCNTPDEYVDDEVVRLYPDEAQERMFISLGTGNGPEVDMPLNKGILKIIPGYIDMHTVHEAQRRVGDEMRRRLSSSHRRIQPTFDRAIDLDSTADEDFQAYRDAFEKQLPEFETIARDLLINHDNWQDSGRQRFRPQGIPASSAAAASSSHVP